MMTVRIAKKIVGGRCDGRHMEVMNRAHRRWWNSARRRFRVSGQVATSSPGLAAQGGYYFTIADRYLYLLDVSTGRWLLPIVKTERQAQVVLAQLRRLGGPVPDGKRLVVDGDAFVDGVVREFRGLPVVLAVNFTASGEVISHQTVAWDSSPAPSLVKARAEQTLYQWRRAGAFAA
jgi:hypothetical protein